MYIDNNNGKRPIAFKDIMNAKVFECGGGIYFKAAYEGDAVAVNLDSGAVFKPEPTEFERCFLYPGATLKLQGNGRSVKPNDV